MHKLPLPAIALSLLLSTASAADFDIDNQRTILRQIQYCLDCGSPLLVTRIHPGTTIRCPDCGREQPKLADQYLLTQTYQLCRLCQSPLTTTGHQPGETVECPLCHTRQTLSRDAFPNPQYASGLGYAPGFPPGSAKKSLLFSPERPDAAITPIPLEPNTPDITDLPAPRDYTRLDIPPPPAPPTPPTTPAPAPPLAIAAPELPALPPLARPTDRPAKPIDVPVVSVDMFGGKRPAASPPATRTPGTLSGDIVARVDGSPIFASEIDRIADPVITRMREMSTPEQSADLAAKEKSLRKEILQRLIDRELAVREAARLGHRPDPEAVRRRETELTRQLGPSGIDARREAERDVTMSEMRRLVTEKPGAVSPEAVRDYYRKNTGLWQRERLLALDQLAVFQDRTGKPDKRNYLDIAAEISRELEKGAKFDDVRRRFDEFAPASGIQPPPPTLLPESAYASQIIQTAGSLRKGAVFGPVLLEGLALFGKVVDERPAGPAPFEEVEKEIRSRLENEAAEKTLDQWLLQLRQRSVVELYDGP